MISRSNKVFSRCGLNICRTSIDTMSEIHWLIVVWYTGITDYATYFKSNLEAIIGGTSRLVEILYLDKNSRAYIFIISEEKNAHLVCRLVPSNDHGDQVHRII